MTPSYLWRKATADQIGAVLRSLAVLAYRRLPTSFGFFAALEMAAFVLFATLLLGAETFKIGTQQDDLVTSIPGLLWNITFKTYSGYLEAGAYDGHDGYMHYMLVESKNKPDTDPVVLWLQGGPGCSGFAGAFEEMGPFYVNKDGQTLYENVYAWNNRANFLFFESPVGVGYSFLNGKPGYSKANDNQTMTQNYNSLKSFFKKFPNYANRQIMEGLINGDFNNPNFGGIAIGNGYMDIQILQSKLVLWSFYHGRFSLEDWDYVKKSCCISKTPQDADTCDFFSKTQTTDNWLDFVPQTNTCGDILKDVIKPPKGQFDQYNFYEDCYYVSKPKASSTRFHRSKRESVIAAKARYHNTADLINYNSTDFEFGYPCWQDYAVNTYFDRPDVQKAFHIDAANLTYFSMCNDPIYNQYKVDVITTKPYFKYMINNAKNASLPNFRILVYNGDVDTVCNFLGDAQFIDEVVTDKSNPGFTKSQRHPWMFRSKTGGFVQRTKGPLSIDVLTIKGAGHMVPMDRPGPAMQMINAFIAGKDYSNDLGVNMVPKPAPLNPQ
ncbi:hypothetical protein L596_008982 [Steinernema carpocapsae]|uniref:Carboxypeptidase n=1 Tax=Steinernema carpocapsae TaxID=34508 RepID=A0A4U5PE80_STECR|nr:hypothetical protein L596_008982 [Steinernema carpocapsae]